MSPRAASSPDRDRGADRPLARAPPGRWPAPAKLNLFLRVTGRRPDGYHELQTLYQFLDLGDEIDLRLRRDGRIRRVMEVPGVAAADDLAVRAARLLKTATGAPAGVDIGVRKRIPMGAGMGGGSSDAATVLLALNARWETGLTRDQLAELGLRLGADVPVFVHGRAAWAEGVGERLTPVEPSQPWYLVVHPGCHVSTAAVFSAPALTRNSPPLTIPGFLRGGSPGDGTGPAAEAFFDEAGNDCEAVVRRRYPEVDDALRWLSGFGRRARLTGTGAGVFLPCRTEREARSLQSGITGRWQAFVARGLNRSPMARDRAAEAECSNPPETE